jgi:alkylation response protein AidB-like acyl-CoA dehydrogenase
MSVVLQTSPHRTQWRTLAADLSRKFADRAAAADANDQFVATNYDDLKAAGVLTAAVPRELGGGGVAYEDLIWFLRELAGYCGSTALALSMHTHQVVIAAWRMKYQNAPTEALLRRVAAENLVLVSSGGSDWLTGTGTAERVDGGYRIKGRKVFSSGSPAGDIMLTSAVYDNPESGPEVLHFALPLKAEGVRLLDTWRVMGMRGTGSQDVEIDNFFLADAAVAGRRPQGKWHMLFHVTSMLAFPLIYAVYLGIAEAARDLALDMTRKRKTDSGLIYTVGEMERELTTARLGHDHMVAAALSNNPGPETTNQVMMGRAICGAAVLRTVEKAMEVAGGAAFYRTQPLERMFRDIQAARYHPLQDKPQLRLAGRLALGLDIDE